jgi:hypothetical protein
VTDERDIPAAPGADGVPASANPHFQTASSWTSARAMLAFNPVQPTFTAGVPLESLRIHVRDHKRRELAAAERTLEAHYRSFVVSESRKGLSEAKRLALNVRYGANGRDTRVGRCAGRMYELGPEPPRDDIDGRSPSVVTWHDGEMFYLIASAELPVDVLLRVAASMCR